ncbi:MAG TPA: TrmH family RNA methyltransferase [Candidatus Paceibacterota bacterium]
MNKPGNKIEKKTGNKREVNILIHDIRSTHNVGSIFRTSDAAGVSKIYISGYSPTPKDKWGRARKDIAKVSLGAETSIPWEYIDDPYKLIKKLKKDGFEIVGLEQTKYSTDYKKFKTKKPLLFIVGSEVLGMDKKILSLCDTIVEIPMLGDKESLNVSVAFGVAIFRILGI